MVSIATYRGPSRVIYLLSLVAGEPASGTLGRGSLLWGREPRPLITQHPVSRRATELPALHRAKENNGQEHLLMGSALL